MFGYRFSNLLGSRELGAGEQRQEKQRQNQHLYYLLLIAIEGEAETGETEAKLIYPFTLHPSTSSPFCPLTPHLFRIDDRCVELTEAD